MLGYKHFSTLGFDHLTRINILQYQNKPKPNTCRFCCIFGYSRRPLHMQLLLESDELSWSFLSFLGNERESLSNRQINITSSVNICISNVRLFTTVFVKYTTVNVPGHKENETTSLFFSKQEEIEDCCYYFCWFFFRSNKITTDCESTKRLPK